MKGYSIFQKEGQFVGYNQELVPTFQEAVVVGRIDVVRRMLKAHKGSEELNGKIREVRRTHVNGFRETRNDVKYAGVVNGNLFLPLSTAVYPLKQYSSTFELCHLFSDPEYIKGFAKLKLEVLDTFYDTYSRDWVRMYKLRDTTEAKKELDDLRRAIENMELVEYEFVPSF